MEDDFASIIFKNKEKQGLFNFSNDTIDKLEEKQRNYSDDLLLFIDANVPKEVQDKLVSLIEKNVDITEKIFLEKNKLYYKAGVIDGMKMVSPLDGLK